MDRTADIPKNARFTFGQRLDNLALDALQSVPKPTASRRSGLPAFARRVKYPGEPAYFISW